MKNSHGVDKSRATGSAATNVSTEISKIGITAIGITAGIIGCWAVASMIAGVINSGGPVDLMASLFKAISG
jgi:hypothetical protein